MRRVGVQDDIRIAGRPTLAAYTNSPVPVPGQLAVELAKHGTRPRLEVAAGQGVRNGWNITARRGVEEDTSAVLVQALVQLLPVHSHQPVQPMFGVRPQPRLQAVGGSI